MKSIQARVSLIRQGRSRCRLPALLALAGSLCAVLPAVAGGSGGLTAGPPRLSATPLRNRVETAETAGDWNWHGERASALVVRYFRWIYSIPTRVDPFSDPSGLNCALNQEGPVWFLSGPLATTFNTTCTLPAGKAVMSAVASYINDYPCPDPTFQPATGQSLHEFLRDGAASLIDTYTLAEASLDGKPLRVARVRTGVFGFTGAASLAVYDGCITGSPQLGLVDGYFVVIEPLPRGTHELRLRSIGPFGSSEGTIRLIAR